MDDRNNPYGSRDRYGRRSPQDDTEDYGSGRDYAGSSPRDYAASGEFARGRDERSDYRGGYQNDRDDRGGYRSARGDWDRERSQYDRGMSSQRDIGGRAAYGAGAHSERDHGRGRDEHRRGGSPQDRGFLDRAGDEVRSWFGDEEAERRREMDERYDERQSRAHGAGDDHYHSWRRQRIAELDRDYDEYRRENAQRFESEFSGWRSERQTQRDSLRQVREHMEVLGSDGSHLGTVDKVRGDRILLTKADAAAGGHHHSIPSRWIQSVDDKVMLRKTAEEARAHWKDEDGGALFGDDRDDRDWSGEHNLNKSFSGTY